MNVLHALNLTGEPRKTLKAPFPQLLAAVGTSIEKMLDILTKNLMKADKLKSLKSLKFLNECQQVIH